MKRKRPTKQISGERKIELLLNHRGWSYSQIMEYFDCSQGKAYAILRRSKRNKMFPSYAIVTSVLELEGTTFEDELKNAYLQAKLEKEIMNNNSFMDFMNTEGN